LRCWFCTSTSHPWSARIYYYSCHPCWGERFVCLMQCCW